MMRCSAYQAKVHVLANYEGLPAGISGVIVGCQGHATCPSAGSYLSIGCPGAILSWPWEASAETVKQDETS